MWCPSKGGHDTAQSVHKWHGSMVFWDSLLYHQMVGVCHKAQGCQKTQWITVNSFLICSNLPCRTFLLSIIYFYSLRKEVTPTTCSRLQQHYAWLLTCMCQLRYKWKASARPGLFPSLVPGQISVETELPIRNAWRLIQGPFWLEGHQSIIPNCLTHTHAHTHI